MITFEPFPKLSRISRGCTITEKLDGTNAQVIVTKIPEDYLGLFNGLVVAGLDGYYEVAAGSRTRLITPGKTADNYGFAGWVYENSAELVKLGEGRHFGEWWGKGIQRGYGLDEKRFSLFDVHKWPDVRPRPACVSVVPVLHRGEFSSDIINTTMEDLRTRGSYAATEFTGQPEGIVIYHEAAKVSFKKTFDDGHKEAKAA